MRQCRRGEIFVDREVQAALLWRVTGYWLFCLLSITLLLVCWTVASGPPRRSAEVAHELYLRYAPALVASLLVLPLVMIDVVRLSNRFVGPIVRLRGALRRMGAGEQVAPIKFRDGDFWHELADSFNLAARRLPEPQAAETASEPAGV
ncbi:MAG: hypothetical protein SFU86_15685 [Pirellulaceae bacterium]|nr:hypothetical protein [Pirellulaceae bacterium]